MKKAVIHHSSKSRKSFPRFLRNSCRGARKDRGPLPVSLNYLENLRRKVESFGIALYKVGAMGLGINDKIHLALAGRDEAIERFSQFIRNLGDAGISTTTFTWEPAGARSSRISCSASC